MATFHLSDKDFADIRKSVFGDERKKKDNDMLSLTQTAPQKQEKQGIIGDFVDSVQRGMYQGFGDLSRSVGVLTGSEGFNKFADWAAEQADAQFETMSPEMQEALGQSALDGEGKGLLNARWWAGNIGAVIGANLDALATMGGSAALSAGIKQGGKYLAKKMTKETAEAIGETAIKQAAKRGILPKYYNVIGYSAVMSAMGAGNRANATLSEYLELDDNEVVNHNAFRQNYHDLKNSEEGQGLDHNELFDMAKEKTALQFAKDSAFDPTAMLTDLGVNALGGIGGGFGGALAPAKTLKGGFVKGALIEGATEGLQGYTEQQAINRAAIENYDPNRDINEGVTDNVINSMVLGAGFGAPMGSVDVAGNRTAVGRQKKEILKMINTGNEEIDAGLRNYVDTVNQNATDLAELVSLSRVNALNAIGQKEARAKQMMMPQETATTENETGENQATAPDSLNAATQRFTQSHAPMNEQTVNATQLSQQFAVQRQNPNNSHLTDEQLKAKLFDEAMNRTEPQQPVQTETNNAPIAAPQQEESVVSQDIPTDDTNGIERVWKGKQNGQPFLSAKEAEMSKTFKDALNGELNPVVINKNGVFLVEMDDVNQFANDSDIDAYSDNDIDSYYDSYNGGYDDSPRFSRSDSVEIPSFYETETRLGGREAYNQAVKNGETELTYRQWVQVRTPEFKAWFGDWENDPNNASKAINPKTGEPLVVYHGSTNYGFTTFKDEGVRGIYFTDNKEIADSYYDQENGNGNSYATFVDIKKAYQKDFEGQKWDDYIDPKDNAVGDYFVLNQYDEIEARFTKKEKAQQFIHDNTDEDFELRIETIDNVDPNLYDNDTNGVSTDYLAVDARSRGYNGTVFHNVKDRYDGFSTNENDTDSTVYVAFNSNQIKSATDNNGNFDPSNNDIRYSLNESPNSDFAKAVDDVVNGNVPQGRISMGTTPDVLKMLGLPKTQIRITGAVIQKVMGEYLGIDGSGHSHIHNLTPDTLKQLPSQINNPVAVFKSSTKENSYVVLTELNEFDRRTGKYKPVVSALHINVGKGNVEVIDVRSVYGRSDNQLVTAFREDLLYLNKAKGQQFLKTHPLQLHWDLTSDANLSASNIKTEAELSQYRTQKNLAKSFDVNAFNQALIRAVGESAVENIDVIQRGTMPDGMKKLIASDVEGWFDPRTNKITLVADGIHATPNMTKEQRIAWVAWHELAHRGVSVRLKGEYKSVMHRADSHPVINAVATAIQQQRQGTQDSAATSRHAAIEEALAEVFSAYQTGNFAELESRYGVNTAELQNPTFKSWLDRFADKVRALIDKLFGTETADKFSNDDLIALMTEIRQGALSGDISSTVNAISNLFSTQSKSESFKATEAKYGGEEAYNQAKADGETDLTYHQWIQVRTPEFKAWFGDWENDPDSSSKVVNEITGEPLVVYHGTNQEFNTFKVNPYNPLIFFTDSKILGEAYQYNRDGITYESFLNARNPRVIDMEGGHWQGIFDESTGQYTSTNGFAAEARRIGYDAAFINNVQDNPTSHFEEIISSVFVVFNPNQIKSATDNNGNFDPSNNDIRYSLNESPNSDFARAVDTVANGGRVRGYVNIGTTPSVLKMLGLPDVKVTMHNSTFNKVMGDKHNISPDALKQLPRQINNPIAVMKSAPQASRSGYVILTELIEHNRELGINEPVVAALHFKQDANGIELINVASVYGKNLRGMQNMLNHDLLYWNKAKGLQFIDTFGLQLPAYVSNDANLSNANIKTNEDLMQALPEIKFSRVTKEMQETYAKLGGAKQESVFTQMVNVVQEGKSRSVPEWKSWLSELGRKTNTAIFDALAPLKYFEDDAGVTDPSKSAYTAARLAAGSSSIVEASMMYGLPEFDKDGFVQRKQGTSEKDSLLGIMESLGNDGEDFLFWVAGNRADKLYAEGRENNLTPQEIARLKTLNKGREAKFENARKKLMTWNKAMLDFAQEAGLFTKEERAQWEDPDWYIPFYREKENGDAAMPYKNKGLASQSAGIRRLKGGENATSDLLGNIIANSSKLIDASVKNMAMTKAVVNLADSGVITTIEKPNLIDYQRLGKSTKEGGLATVKIKGQQYLIEVHDQALFNALTRIDYKPNHNFLRKMAIGAKRLLTSTVTSMPDFIVRNFLRDIVQSATTDRNSIKLGVDALKGLKEAYSKNGAAIDLMFSGASFGSGYIDAGDPKVAAEKIRRHLRKKGYTKAEADSYMSSIIWSKDQLVRVLDKYKDINSAVENANRIAVYNSALQNNKSRIQAAFEAKDLMDFSMQGNAQIIRLLADVLPFFNARLQGLSQLGRALKDNPRKVAVRGMMIAAASSLLSALNAGNDAYEELPDEEKDNYWHIFAGDEHFRIPKPFEIGVIFGTVPERLFRTMNGLDSTGRFADRVFAAMSDTLSMNPIPQLVKPVLEVYNNKDSFTGREIESMSDRRLLPEARYDHNTSIIARSLGEVTGQFGVSPKQLEHLVRGYFGTMGMYVLGMSDRVIRAGGDYGEKPQQYWNEYPVLSALFRGDVNVPRKYTSYMNDYYNYLNKATEITATANSYEEEGKIQEQRQLLQDNARLLAYKPALNKVQKEVRQIKASMDLIMNDRILTAEQKRERLDRLIARRNGLIKSIAERMREEDF